MTTTALRLRRSSPEVVERAVRLVWQAERNGGRATFEACSRVKVPNRESREPRQAIEVQRALPLTGYVIANKRPLTGAKRRASVR